MAVDKKGLLAKIELKFKGKSISKNFKEALANKWADKIDTEEEVDDFIDAREDVVLEAAAEGDRIRTEAKKKPVAGVETVETVEVKTDEGKTDMEKLTEMVTTLAGTVKTMQESKTKETILQQAQKSEHLADIPAAFYKGRALPADEAGIEAWAEEIKTDYTEFATEHKITPTEAKPGDAPRHGVVKKAVTGAPVVATAEEVSAAMKLI